jgi:acetyl-CoA carboxylase biotin carboxyl carrier protein
MTVMSQQDLESLIELFDRSDWREMRLQGLGVELFVSKDPNARPGQPSVAGPRAAPAATLVPPIPAPPVPPGGVEIPGNAGTLHVTAATQAHWVPVRAPCLGTFYAAPKPGAAPFVAVGQRVTADTEVCIVEVMKLFTTVRAGVAGTVREILARDSQLVEFGHALLLIEPDA